MWLGRPRRNQDGVVVSDGQAQGEFDRAYPSLVTTAARAAQKFFRYNNALVEDTVAETMARTYERWERVRRHPNPAGWVVVCAKNVCLEQLRQSAREVKVPQSCAADELIDLTDESAVSITISESLRKLSKRQRDVIVLRYLLDYDERTTSELMGIKVANVKAAAHEGRQLLNPMLAGVYGDMDEVLS